MPTLAEKVLSLKLNAYLAGRTAMFWEQKIKEHGERKAEEFYLHLGHNHIERKSAEWEGLTLRRQPREAEKIAVKGVFQAQESAKEQIGKVFLALRAKLISDGLEGIEKLPVAQYHELTLQAPPETRQSLRDRLITTYQQGRQLVAVELGKLHKQDEKEDEFDDLDTLTDVSTARVTNDVQSRIAAAAARFVLLGLTGTALMAAIQKELGDGSVSYIDRASAGLAHRVINIGRGDEARSRRSEWERVEYSALLDQNVCGPCAAEDGQEATTEDGLTPVPNPECEGGDWCRCFHVFVAEGNM